MAKRLIEVTSIVEVETDDAKFTEEWLAEWRGVFYPFRSVEDHAKHIAQLAARGIFDPKFTEGYGPPSDMGITARVVSVEEEIIE